MTWTIDQKRERELEDEMKRVGVAFGFSEERSTDGSGGSVKKWTQPNGKFVTIFNYCKLVYQP